MKVGILTLRLHSNFGFLMQSYALQKVVRDFGHEPYHFYIKEEPFTKTGKIIVLLKKIIRNCISGTHYPLWSHYPTAEDMAYKDKNTWDFIKKNLTLTSYVPSLITKKAYEIEPFDAYIVGSDQVWRREFTDDILCYFFSFIPDGVKRMSYAASFGTKDLMYSEKQLCECKKLLKKFDFVTVREDDGIRICREYFDTDATKVLDPTLLLSPDDYLDLIDDPEVPFCDVPYIFTYVLRPNKEKMDFIKNFAAERKMRVINIMPQTFEKVGRKHIKDCVYPSVSSWLKGFSQAEYVLTDSFHASVFSIIFNKQFYVVNDKIGGVTRIPSLLRSFGITGRYAQDYKGVVETIDFSKVNRIRKELMKESLRVLQSFLSK